MISRRWRRAGSVLAGEERASSTFPIPLSCGANRCNRGQTNQQTPDEVVHGFLASSIVFFSSAIGKSLVIRSRIGGRMPPIRMTLFSRQNRVDTETPWMFLLQGTTAESLRSSTSWASFRASSCFSTAAIEIAGFASPTALRAAKSEQYEDEDVGNIHEDTRITIVNH
jgi:hypothetical protein